MKVVALAMLMAMLTACARQHGAAASVQDAAGIPPGCSPMHGGMPETPGKPPVWHRGAPLSTAHGDSALVVVHIVRGLDSLPLNDAHVVFGAAPNLIRARPTDASGYTVVHILPGGSPLVAVRVGHKRLTDTVTIRRGFADTLWLGLGTEKICFT
jgi:hypothetical protein